MKTATITFHASHNYGSMLQAYALQQTILRLGYENEIINLRTLRQKQLYPAYPMVNPFSSLENLVKYILEWTIYWRERKLCIQKYQIFEQFLQDKLILTPEYVSIDQFVTDRKQYDCYIAGGDQIWNTSAFDFDWSFYLPFVKKGKRISYAVSMGRKPDFANNQVSLIREYLGAFETISVREEGTKEMVESLVSRPVSLMLDPVFLLTQQEWESQIATDAIIKGKYILMYSPKYDKEVCDIANKLSKRLNLPVVNTIFIWKMLKYRFIHKLDVGPLEFVNLIANSTLVVSGSYHALVFSAIFHKPFFAVNGNRDNRMITFLKTMNLQNRTICIEDSHMKVAEAFQCDFTDADKYLQHHRTLSIDYLQKVIGYGEK